MSSLWTPYGEEPVGPGGSGDPGAGGPPPGAGGPGGPGGPGPDLEAELDPEQMQEMLARLAATPVEAIVTQFAVQLQEIAVLHLGLASQRPESLGQAALAIDAMGGLVEALGDRLGPNAVPLRQTIAQLRLAYVEVSGGGAGEPPADQEPGEGAPPASS